jgi:propionyl-CoA carboxylase alpha chain
MIRVAAGEKLSIAQDDVKLTGWAMESRIYAEDPYRNFLPSTGRLVRYQPPEERVENGVTVRNDTGVYEGGEISIFYDPMIAKLCTHADTREEAVDAMSDALDTFYIEGIQHNIPFLGAIMEHERFRSGNITTGFIAEEYPDGFEGVAVDDGRAEMLAVVAVFLNEIHAARATMISGQLSGRGRELPEDWVVSLDDEIAIPVRAFEGPEGLDVSILDAEGEVFSSHTVESDWCPGDTVFTGEVDGKNVVVQTLRAKGLQGYNLGYRGSLVNAAVRTERGYELSKLMPEKIEPDTSNLLLCPMPGLVVSIHVEVGQSVQAGETLAVVEAMKMENILRAERDGVISVVNAEAGDSLAVDAIILEFE